MIERLIALLLGISPRERWLLAALFGLALPVAIGFLWVAPLLETRQAGLRDLTAAQNLRLWVDARAVENAALLRTTGAQTDDTVQNQPPIGISGIEQSLKVAGLRQAVTRLANRDGDAIELRFDLVDFTQLTDWMMLAQPTWGYELRAFRFERGERAGLVAAEFLLGLAK